MEVASDHWELAYYVGACFSFVFFCIRMSKEKLIRSKTYLDYSCIGVMSAVGAFVWPFCVFVLAAYYIGDKLDRKPFWVKGE